LCGFDKFNATGTATATATAATVATEPECNTQPTCITWASDKLAQTKINAKMPKCNKQTKIKEQKENRLKNQK